MRQKLRNLSAAMAVNLAVATPAWAQSRPVIDNPVRSPDLGAVLAAVIKALLLFAGAVAVLFLIIGGFRYVISAGNAEQVEAAKKTILYAVLGLIVIFLAFVLVQLIQNYLGVEGGFTIQGR